jgi:hypothetical protein
VPRSITKLDSAEQNNGSSYNQEITWVWQHVCKWRHNCSPTVLSNDIQEATVNAEHYHGILIQFMSLCWRSMRGTCGFNTMGPHCANKHGIFTVIFWRLVDFARSPNLSLPHLLLWDHLSWCVYKNNPQSIKE